MVVAVGNFDGVHLGHAAVIKRACKEAFGRGEKALVYTFENHPRAFLGSDVNYIVSNEKRRDLIMNLGAGDVYFQRFDHEFCEKSPEEFIVFLQKKFMCDIMVCGADFRFGKNAQGHPENIKGVKVIIVPDVNVDGMKVSSSRIRALISSGNVEEANKLLGYVFSVRSIVVHGRHLGTELGFPTMNQRHVPGLILPSNGVYATYVRCGSETFEGITNIGVRPSVETGGDITVETFLLNASPDINLYGTEAETFFIFRLRSEKKFESLEALSDQIKKDCSFVRDFFSKNEIIL